MELKKLFTPVESKNAQESRAYMADHPEGSYNLVDVRQPKEYKESHIPGAKLIPLPDLADSLDDLDPEKPTMVYCAIGGRSRVAAQLLSGKGFKEVINMSGGIKAWDGDTAVGPLELNLDLITGEESPEDVVRLAYCMEHTLGGFYTAMKSKAEDQTVADLLGKLAGIEERHKEYLVDVYKTIEPAGIDKNELENSCNTIMEGGFKVEDFIKQNEHLTRTSANLIDLSMMLEAQALDLYMRFAQKIEKEETKELLFKIGDEEKAHLRALGKLRDEVT